MVNTVTAAQRVFRAVQRLAVGDVVTLLFHARFPAWRRQQVEEEVMALFGKSRTSGPARPYRAILVSTQVVEQSLDLDFDVMFSELAPIDRVLQRAGRLWRHLRPARPIAEPVLHVIGPPDGSTDFGDSQRIYERIHLLRTLGTLLGREEIHLPRDFRPLISEVYDDLTAACGSVRQDEIETAVSESKILQAKDNAAAQKQLIGRPNPKTFRYPQQEFTVEEADEGEAGHNLRAQTRKGDQTRPIFALTRPEDSGLLERLHTDTLDRATLRALFLTRSSVPVWWLGRRGDSTIGQARQIHGAPILDLCDAHGQRVQGIFFRHDLGLFVEEAFLEQACL
jgi:CRISPR-associated endonuclease/helicase Cas3